MVHMPVGPTHTPPTLPPHSSRVQALYLKAGRSAANKGEQTFFTPLSGTLLYQPALSTFRTLSFRSYHSKAKHCNPLLTPSDNSGHQSPDSCLTTIFLRLTAHPLSVRG